MATQRELQRFQAEVAELRRLTLPKPDDRFAKPLLLSRLREQESELAELEKDPAELGSPATLGAPTSWLAFEGRPTGTSARPGFHPAPSAP